MKRKLFSPLCFGLFLVACSGNQAPVASGTDGTSGAPAISAMAQKNLAAVHAVDEAFKTGDVSGLDSVIADSFVDHTEKGDKNRDSLKAMIKMWHVADKTMKMETTKEVADDSYVFSQMHITGTGDGAMMPAGPYDMHTVEVVKFANGKAVEHWGYWEMGEVMKAMSPPPVMQPAKEAKKK